MFKLLKLKVICLLGGVLTLLAACDTFEADVTPKFFTDFELRRDSIFMYSTRWDQILQPLENDSLKVSANVTYGQPKHGQLLTDVDGTKYYELVDVDYVGLDSIPYQVCSGNVCKTEKIILVLEKPIDLNNCITKLVPYTVETFVNTPVDIRVHRKDFICPYLPSYWWDPPAKGSFKPGYPVHSTSNPKSTVLTYIPPKNYVGQDSFNYRVSPDGSETGYLHNTVTIIIKPKP